MRIGILGGGQLARMLAQAAQDYGFQAHIYAPEEESPAFEVTRFFTCAQYDDENSLKIFAENCDVITYEFENVPFQTAEFLNTLKPVLPQPSALKITQDRILEKTLFKDLNLNTPLFFQIDSQQDLEKALAITGFPAILKTRRFGYDGKGQVRIKNNSDAKTALAELKNAPSILESFVNFSKEVSVIIARNAKNEQKCFELCENEHKNGILFKTKLPANVTNSVKEKALNAATLIANKLNYIGVLTIEMFVVGEEIYINECAPRVHNSGHWTKGGAITSQFHQHIRAITHLPLGETTPFGKIEMLNLIGNEMNQFNTLLKEANIPVDYGKKETREGRKMGHITNISLDKPSNS